MLFTPKKKTVQNEVETIKIGLVSIKELAKFLNRSYDTAKREMQDIREQYEVPKRRVLWEHVYNYYKI